MKASLESKCGRRLLLLSLLTLVLLFLPATAVAASPPQNNGLDQFFTTMFYSVTSLFSFSFDSFPLLSSSPVVASPQGSQSAAENESKPLAEGSATVPPQPGAMLNSRVSLAPLVYPGAYPVSRDRYDPYGAYLVPCTEYNREAFESYYSGWYSPSYPYYLRGYAGAFYPYYYRGYPWYYLYYYGDSTTYYPYSYYPWAYPYYAGYPYSYYPWTSPYYAAYPYYGYPGVFDLYLRYGTLYVHAGYSVYGPAYREATADEVAAYLQGRMTLYYRCDSGYCALPAAAALPATAPLTAPTAGYPGIYYSDYFWLRAGEAVEIVIRSTAPVNAAAANCEEFPRGITLFLNGVVDPRGEEERVNIWIVSCNLERVDNAWKTTIVFRAKKDGRFHLFFVNESGAPSDISYTITLVR